MNAQNTPQPIDGAGENTIQENLLAMNYPAKEDLMRQGEEIDMEPDAMVNEDDMDEATANTGDKVSQASV